MHRRTPSSWTLALARTPIPLTAFVAQVVQKNIRGRSTRNNVKRRADAARQSIRVDAGSLQKQLSMRELPERGTVNIM